MVVYRAILVGVLREMWYIVIRVDGTKKPDNERNDVLHIRDDIKSSCWSDVFCLQRGRTLL